jgi:wyosine [tRNA(Phe)-imidazoG37] synthetase (radical SAM superfamily)
MAFHPQVHPAFESLRWGRILFVEVSPAPPAGRACRYCDVLTPESRVAERSHFSSSDSAVRTIVGELERGASVEAVVLGGAGDPLRHRGLGSILRQLRQTTHVATVVLSDGRLLADRQVRREVGEAGTVSVWLPALEDRKLTGPKLGRREAYERHVEGVASLARESPVNIVLELPVRPGVNDGPESRAAWKRAAQRIHPTRVLVIAARAGGGDPAALESVREAIHPKAGAYLDDGTIADWRCFCESTVPTSD